MSRRTQIILSDRQHSFLRDEAFRSGLSMGELIRRAVDGPYRPHTQPTVPGFDFGPAAFEQRVGRRPTRRRGG